MLVPQKNKTWTDKSVEHHSSLVPFWKEGIPYLSLFAVLFQEKYKLIKKGEDSPLPFKFSRTQWFLEHWILASDVVSSPPRWGICRTSSCKTSSMWGKSGQSLRDKRRCQWCNQKQQAENKPRNVHLSLQQCGDAAEIIWHLCASFSSLSFIFPPLPSEAPVSAGSGFCGNYGQSAFPSEKRLLWQPYIMYMA